MAPGMDGATEFFAMDKLQDILQEVEFKSRLPHLGLTIHKGITLKGLEEKQTSWKLKKEHETCKPRRQHSEKFKTWGFHCPVFYAVVDHILENKEAFTYYEREEPEGVRGFLVFKSIDLNVYDCMVHGYFDYRSYPTDWDSYVWEIGENGEMEHQLVFEVYPDRRYAVGTCPVRKNPTMEEYRNGSDYFRLCALVNARMSCFQRICRRELVTTPMELQRL
ncbi:MAG TPA: hypothetical protein VMV32_07480 [Ignavibacteriaceae bacterium]|nr:hypothetical protein [Ignavibacteriaceae bacterium]